MKRLAILAALFAISTLPVTGADPKLLQNVKGAVSYQKANAAAPKTLAPSAQIALNDSDTAITGDASLGQVLLPDTTKITMGADTKVQLAFFNQAATTTANFVVYDGKVRFDVQHPAGAPASYTFKTPSAQIAVRGTQGDIGVCPSGLDVNVYHLGDENNPVVVTTSDGQSFKLLGGQGLAAQIINGVIRATVSQLTQAALDKFDSQFGFPPTVDGVTNYANGVISGAAANAANNATGGIAGGVVGNAVSGALGGLFHKKPAATPTPASDAGGCSA